MNSKLTISPAAENVFALGCQARGALAYNLGNFDCHAIPQLILANTVRRIGAIQLRSSQVREPSQFERVDQFLDDPKLLLTFVEPLIALRTGSLLYKDAVR